MITSDSQVGLDDLVCPKCYYNLRGVTSGACPECGEAFDAKFLLLTQRHRPREARIFRRIGWLLLVCFIASLPPMVSIFLLAAVVPMAVVTTGVIAWDVARLLTVERLIRSRGEFEHRTLFHGSTFVGIWILYLALCLSVIVGGCTIGLGTFGLILR